LSILAQLILPLAALAAPESAPEPAKLERSYWLHASLGLLTQKGYWGSEFPGTNPPTCQEVQNAAKLLCGPYAASRLYLIYHKEMPVEDARQVFLWWRQACPAALELVPTLVLRMYDKPQTPANVTVSTLREPMKQESPNRSHSELVEEPFKGLRRY